jgi:hypothetical protein
LLLSYNNSWTGQNYFLNNVGINTTNPTKNLDVNGDVRISGNVDIYIPSSPDSKMTIYGGDRTLFRSNYGYYKIEFEDNNASPIIQIIASRDNLGFGKSFSIDFNNNKAVNITGDQLFFYSFDNGIPVFNYAYGTYIQLNQPTFLLPGQKGFGHYSLVNQFNINVDLPYASNSNRLALYRMYVIITSTSASNMDIKIFPNGTNGDGTFYYTSFNNGGSSNATTSNAFFFDVFNGTTDNYPYIIEFLIMPVPSKKGIISMRASGKGAASFGTCVWEANNMIWSSIGTFLSVSSEMGDVYYIIERIL